MFLSRVESFIASNGLLPEGKHAPVIVAVSGGADSVALLHVLRRLGYPCIVAHCNFGLRGRESERDEQFVRTLAREMGVELRVAEFDTKRYASEHGLSIEMACRDLRYNWFEQLREATGAQAIAVGHHRDDSRETFFLNLLRGSGLTGLAGIRPRNGFVIRPLLCLSRDEIEKYVTDRGLQYITDSTNLENDYRRNRIRNVVMPAIRSCFNSPDDAISESIEYLSQARSFLGSVIERLRTEYTDGEGSINIAALSRDYGSHSSFVLFEMLKEQGMKMTTVNAILNAVGESGKIFDDKWLLDRGRLLPYTPTDHADFQEVVALNESPFEMEVFPKADFSPTGDPFTAYYDESVLEGNPVFVLRSWRAGDRIAPFGMRGTKKLSDLYRDASMSLNDKSRALVLERDGIILWAIGVRASRHFAVTPSSKRFIRLKFKS